MILQHKTSNKVYNLIGIENNGLELTLKLAYWHKTPKGGYRKSTRSTSVYSWEALIEQISKFEEVGVGEITANDVKKWLNELGPNDD